MAAIEGGNVLAVGWFRAENGMIFPLVEQWNGQSWKDYAPEHRPGYSSFFGLGVIGSVRWAVGSYALPNPVSATLIEASCAP